MLESGGFSPKNFHRPRCSILELWAVNRQRQAMELVAKEPGCLAKLWGRAFRCPPAGMRIEMASGSLRQGAGSWHGPPEFHCSKLDGIRHTRQRRDDWEEFHTSKLKPGLSRWLWPWIVPNYLQIARCESEYCPYVPQSSNFQVFLSERWRADQSHPAI